MLSSEHLRSHDVSYDDIVTSDYTTLVQKSRDLVAEICSHLSKSHLTWVCLSLSLSVWLSVCLSLFRLS